MIIDGAALRTLNTAFNTAYRDGLTMGVAPMWDRIATEVPSSTGENEYGWLGHPLTQERRRAAEHRRPLRRRAPPPIPLEAGFGRVETGRDVRVAGLLELGEDFTGGGIERLECHDHLGLE